MGDDQRVTGWLLRVETPRYVAGAVFHKIHGQWKCVKAAPIMKWMVLKETSAIEEWIRKSNHRYTWIAIRDQ